MGKIRLNKSFQGTGARAFSGCNPNGLPRIKLVANAKASPCTQSLAIFTGGFCA